LHPPDLFVCATVKSHVSAMFVRCDRFSAPVPEKISLCMQPSFDAIQPSYTRVFWSRKDTRVPLISLSMARSDEGHDHMLLGASSLSSIRLNCSAKIFLSLHWRRGERGRESCVLLRHQTRLFFLSRGCCFLERMRLHFLMNSRSAFCSDPDLR